jgi:23S rRNA (cytidine1920-2'-O)/16S rRNA (cytidine1409-2'-O)-methyltransferase
VTSHRLDTILVDKGLAASRTKAAALVKEGAVLVNGVVSTKPSYPVYPDDDVMVTRENNDVGRGAMKLRHAVAEFDVNFSNLVVVDVGASTGGFTQVALDAGARLVVALDVGHDQLDPGLISHPRVRNLEGTNVAQVTPDTVTSWQVGRVDAAVVDLSFTSLASLLPHLVELFPHAFFVLLVKPQFEVGKGNTRAGIVTDTSLRQESLEKVLGVLGEQGFQDVAWCQSPVTGKKGNIEYLVYAPKRKTVE